MHEENEVMETEEFESEETQEVAEPDETEEITEEGENDQEVAEPEPQSRETNAAFASMRRQAEAEAQRKMDMKIASLCKGVTNPITGAPINTFAEYEEAIAAQNRIQAESQLRDNGLDISILDDYVNSSPVLAKAQAIIEKNEAEQAEAKLKNDFEELQKLNPDIKTFNDLNGDERINDILARVRNGASLVEAYKIVNFDKLMERGTKGAKQAAINQARGKSHLEPTEAISESEDSEISETMLHALRNNFPDKSEKEIRKLYKQTYK